MRISRAIYKNKLETNSSASGETNLYDINVI